MSIFELRQQASPLVISVPHDGALIPDDILSQMNPAVIGSSDRDLLISEVFEFENLKYSKIKANYSRHVIDLNRPATGEALYQNQTETELCPTSTFDFKDIYQAGQQPDQAEIKRRIETYWQPYHQKLAELIAAAKAQFGFCLLIDAHSIDDEVPRFFEGQLPDINVGTFAGKSCSAEIERQLMEHLSKQSKFTFVNNGRFKGGFITRNYGQPDNHIHAIQLEHAKSCYLNQRLKLSEQANTLNKLWLEFLTNINLLNI
ncbi:MAG: N-formylglutamate amidohydrolase [Marinicella sp.]